MKVEYNISRLDYLLDIFSLSYDNLLHKINKDIQKPITVKELKSSEIEVRYLKRIDKVFEQGLSFYLDPTKPPHKNKSSIFFRKTNFSAELNFVDRKKVVEYEELKNYISGIAKLSGVNISRKIKKYSIKDDPREVALSARLYLKPSFKSQPKSYLQEFIGILSEHRVIVLEFVEHPNLNDITNIDGFYLKPNFIVIKRQQHYLKREIFTLAHELGHLLLDEEDVDASNYAFKSNLSKSEKWCNNFAFYFLAGNHIDRIELADEADESNNFQEKLIADISQKTHLSRLAILTQFRNLGKIRPADYLQKKNEIEAQIERLKEKQRNLLEGVEIRGIAKPILSPTIESTIVTAVNEGIIDEIDAYKSFKLSASQLDKLFQ